MAFGEITLSFPDAVKVLSGPETGPAFEGKKRGVGLTKSSESSSFAGRGDGRSFSGIAPSSLPASSSRWGTL